MTHPRRRASDIARDAAIARNLATIAELERNAVRVTTGYAGRCFEMSDGTLLRIANEQTPGSPFQHIQHVLPLAEADAEDGYGWSRRG